MSPVTIYLLSLSIYILSIYLYFRRNSNTYTNIFKLLIFTRPHKYVPYRFACFLKKVNDRKLAIAKIVSDRKATYAVEVIG